MTEPFEPVLGTEPPLRSTPKMVDDQDISTELDECKNELAAAVAAYQTEATPENLRRFKAAQAEVFRVRSAWREQETAAGNRGFLMITNNEV